jgi:hypothetical protein
VLDGFTEFDGEIGIPRKKFKVSNYAESKLLVVENLKLVLLQGLQQDFMKFFSNLILC